jgi:Mannosyltransferase putative
MGVEIITIAFGMPIAAFLTVGEKSRLLSVQNRSRLAHMETSVYQAIERRRAAPAQYPEDRFEGRGIVICAGGVRYFTCAWVLIAILRRVHRTVLPIQVWHLGRREMSEEMRILLTEEGVEVVDAETAAARCPARLAGGWPLKPYAIAQSRFREVLYLDADTVPLVDPQVAFEWDEYRDSGLLLWPDKVDIKKSNPIWARLGLEAIERASIDSGLMLADKARVWDVLDLTVLMNEHWDEIYDVLYGDKDTFLLSAQLLNRTFGCIPHRPFLLEWDMVQRDPSGEPFLHHRTRSKWLLNYPNRPMAAPLLMPSCEAALADLRMRWSGTVFHAPERSPQARAEEARLIAVRTFRYEADTGERDIELWPGGRMGAGTTFERHWAVVDRAGKLVLQFYVGNVPTATLDKSNDGSWHGVAANPDFEIRLEDRPAGAASLFEADDRILRSADDLVGAFVQPALFALGYDEERASAVKSALSLLNDMYDDVPEQIIEHATRHRAPMRWQSALDRLAAKLASTRDRRIALVRREEIAAHGLKPRDYARPV